MKEGGEREYKERGKEGDRGKEERGERVGKRRRNGKRGG